MNIYVIEDNENIRDAAAGYLKLEGFEVCEFGEIRPAAKIIDSTSGDSLPDLILLDVMLPDGDGFFFAKQLKAGTYGDKASEIPVIFLTARGQESDRITGFELGADDYIMKPFSNREMVLRVKAVLKRSQKKNLKYEKESKYVLDSDVLLVSKQNHKITLNNEPLQLTAAEWNIVVFLAEHSSQVFNRIQLLEYCLDSIAEGSERTIDTHVKNIRHKLKGQNWIETVRGFGYRFNGTKT
ncbi:MAG: response regulator transcription factor [Spirochaetales bacterium]|nr:response regulator transcription factor [Spirochaetales bacterium]